MEDFNLFAYAMTLAAVNAAPGPIIAVVLASVLGGDVRGGAAFAVGVGCGDIAAVLLVGTGMALWAENWPTAIDGLRLLGCVYILSIAISIWRGAGTGMVSARTGSGRMLPSFAAGVAACLCNPYTLLFFIALLPGLLKSEQVGGLDLAALVFVTALVNCLMFLVLIRLAMRMSAMITDPMLTRPISRLFAVTLAVSAVWIATG